MAFVLLNATPWVHGYDFTGDSNKIQLAVSRVIADATTFATTGWRSKASELMDVTAHLDGFWSSAADLEGFGDLGGQDRPVTVSPTGLLGSVGFMFQASKFVYSPFGAVGALTPFALDLRGSNMAGLVRGQVAAVKQAVSATGALGAGVQLGAVGSTQYLYGSFHVFGPPGTTITVQVQSATSNAFTSPTTRATIGPLTTQGGTWMARVAGAITDTWWRYNVSAVTGSFTVSGSLGIQ